ncbi:twin-arginine translocase TatA/TatE family subunit [Litorivivens sp.]|uniref:twin-arginine translocase TatA/TatE family subunit n=1 Tax=Litorivivens sp. TaxID=2020868 RepID=UPI0035686259
MGFGIKELVVILVIVLLLFGTKKLKGIGTDLGSAIKGFKNSMADEDSKANSDKPEGEAEKVESDPQNPQSAATNAEHKDKSA